MKTLSQALCLLLPLQSQSVTAQELGSVSTAFKLLGPDHRIAVEAYHDPPVGGITCYVSRAKTGGVMGGLGLAEDKAEASIACRQSIAGKARRSGDCDGFNAWARQPGETPPSCRAHRAHSPRASLGWGRRRW